MKLSINNHPGGIINFISGTPVTIHQTNGQQTIEVHPSSSESPSPAPSSESPLSGAPDVRPETSSNPNNLSGAPDVRPENILHIPKEGKYTQVREYIRERCRFDAEFKQFVHDRSLRDLCARLTKEFGWFVDEHSLGSNLNRHRND